MTHAYRKVPTLDPPTVAYLAGLIDGEGTISLSRQHAADNRRLAVSIANTELPILDYVKTTIGAGRITRKKTSSERHTPSYCYAIWSRQALELLRQVTPHLRSHKRQRAELVLRHYLPLTPRNGKYTPSLLERRRQFEREFFSIAPSRRRQYPEIREPQLQHGNHRSAFGFMPYSAT